MKSGPKLAKGFMKRACGEGRGAETAGRRPETPCTKVLWRDFLALPEQTARRVVDAAPVKSRRFIATYICAGLDLVPRGSDRAAPTLGNLCRPSRR